MRHICEMANLFPALCICLLFTFGAVHATQIRLVGGSSNGTGRVEVFYKDHWSTLYGYSLEDEDVEVLCRMLGYANSGIAYLFNSGSTVNLFGAGTGNAISQRFNCRGNETDLTQCGSSTSWSTSSSTSYRAAISCESTQIRLADGDTQKSGRVEIFVKGSWATICDSSFDNHDARAICGMLGFSDTGIAQAFTHSHFGQGYGKSVLTSLRCTGTETDIKQCGGTWGESPCNHRLDAGVNCGSTPIRLVNGPNNSSGRVEILHGGSWGTICNRYNGVFDRYNVRVLCGMLGYHNSNAFGHGNGYYGEGMGRVITSNLQCDGSEKDIANCQSTAWQGSSATSILCSHDNDVGVNCLGTTPIRLVDGISEQSGRLEIFHNGHWGTVRSNYFNQHSLAVVCRMLGYEYSSHSYFTTRSYFGQGIGEIVLDGLKCNGDETDIGQCTGNWWPSTKRYTHDLDVGISCDGVIPIRLIGGPTNASGRVEVFHNGNYGTLCDNGFDRYDLIVVCRMLGFENIPSSAYWHASAYYGEGLGEIVVSDLNCNGIEANLALCPGTWPAQSYCTHAKDVSVSCDGGAEKIRLSDGKDTNSGRVEIFHNGRWGTVCGYNFDRADAVVVCRMLGFQKPESAVPYSDGHFGKGNGTTTVASNVHCNGLEANLDKCTASWNPTSCAYGHDAGVDCCPSCDGIQNIVG